MPGHQFLGENIQIECVVTFKCACSRALFRRDHTCFHDTPPTFIAHHLTQKTLHEIISEFIWLKFYLKVTESNPLLCVLNVPTGFLMSNL